MELTDRLTQKSQEALGTAQAIARRYGNQQLEQIHLLLALLEDEGGLIPQLLTAMGVTVPSLTAAAENLVAGLPKVTGSGREVGKVYVSQGLDAALLAAGDFVYFCIDPV